MALDDAGRDGAGPFWVRVRAALRGGRPEPERAQDDGGAAMARAMGMTPRPGGRIDEELAQGWAWAAARRVSLCLIVVEIDRMADYFNAYGKTAMDDCVTEVMHAIAAQLPRDTDHCLHMGRASFGLVMPDMPVLLARATATKISAAVRTLSLVHKESHAGAVTVGMGLAVCNPAGDYDRAFYEAAAEALKKAQRKGLARFEAVDLRPGESRRRLAA